MQLAIRELRRRLGTTVLVAIAMASRVGAEDFGGAVRGRVLDLSGGVVTAEVWLVDGERQTTRSTVTNGRGEYVLASLPPGGYALHVTASGFGEVVLDDVRVGVRSVIAVPDVVLRVAPLSERLSVLASATVSEPSAGAGGASITRSSLETLPTAGRNTFLFAASTPSVVHSGDPQFVRQQDQTSSSAISLAGGPRRSNNYTLDGVSITDMRNRATLIPSLEATEEVRVEVAAHDAAVGRTGGGVFNTVTRSGSNVWRGGLLGQTRPRWAQGRLYFDQKACDEAEGAGHDCRPKPDTHYYLYGGRLGGPVVRDRTFFHASFEGYDTRTARNAILTLPTERERRGDFSQSGATIFDPLTTRPDGNGGYVRDAFPGNVLPADRLNAVALSMLQYLPLPTSGNSRNAVAEPEDNALQAIVKLDHRVSASYQAALTYAWYRSEEPESLFYGGDPGDNPGDPAGGALYRNVHLIALNNTITAGPNTVWSLRYGYTSFDDDETPNTFDPATLGFAPQFLSQITYDKFPVVNVAGVGSPYGTFGDRSPQQTKYSSHNANASVSRLLGRHKVRLGVDYRYLGMKLFAGGQPSGRFSFDDGFTRGPSPLLGDGSGSAFASFLLGYPARGDITIATPNRFRINYYAAHVQDDFRIGNRLTLNVGLRYEREDGLEETHRAFTVGFDRERVWPFQLPDVALRGGLMYAGVDGYPTRQASSSGSKWAPRLAASWSPDARTVVRGGWGRFFAPIQYGYPSETRLGTRGFTAITEYTASLDGGRTPCPGCSLTNPFPGGLEQPQGSAEGILTGAGGTVFFVDQYGRSPYVDQFSLGVEREVAEQVVLSARYLGSRGRRLAVGGSDQALVNVNQLDPAYLSLGGALADLVPNPFYGDPRFGSLALSPTVNRGQLLRPYPQFGDLYAHQVSEGRSSYGALVLQAQRRMRDGWSFDVNYTWSSTSDNLFGDSNFNSNGSAPIDYYDLAAEYGSSLMGAAHRVNLSAISVLPFGRGQKHLSDPGLMRTLFGGWTISAAATFRTGYPVAIFQANNNSGLAGQRPNLTGAAPASSGSTEERLTGWFNPAAWSEAAPFTVGDAPRTETRARTPSYWNVDMAVEKAEPVGRGVTVTLRLEMINLFATANFQGPYGGYGTPYFGQIFGVGGFPRMLQVMLRASF